MARRTVLYSSKGKKLYAVRDKTGKFKDIQQYSRAHAMDIKRKSKEEKRRLPARRKRRGDWLQRPQAAEGPPGSRPSARPRTRRGEGRPPRGAPRKRRRRLAPSRRAKAQLPR